ncbi:MAG: flagellar hook-length control protein FliK [Butyrivibrio sp.]|nr:flagellar hook-length control protein FliK [Butyrivibrio sp.]
MKAGSISPAAEQVQLVQGVRQAGNVDSFAENKSGSFRMFLAANAGKGQEIGIAPTTSAKDEVKAAGEAPAKDFSKLRENTVKDKITEDGEAVKADGTQNAARTDKDKAVSEAEKQLGDAVKKELGLTDEELKAALEQLGLCLADLAVPQNAALLVAEVNNTDVTSIVTDSGLGEQLASLISAVNAVVAETADQFDFKPEQLVQMLEQTEQKVPEDDTSEAVEIVDEAEEEPKPAQPETVVVKDESTGKEIKVTVENGKTVSEAAVQYEKAPEDAKNASEDGRDKRQSNQEQRNENSFADGLVQNLTRAAAERTEGIQNFAESYTVNAADVIHQIIEAVRVNVNSATSSMELQLNPENLGKINLNVVTKNGMVTATITAQNEAVKGIIESQLVQLKESLNNQGLKVQSVEVAVANHGFNLGENGAGQEQGGNREARGRRRFTGFEEPSEEEDNTADALRQRIMEADGNSVNYTA